MTEKQKESMTVFEREGLIRGTVTLVAGVGEHLAVEGFGLARDMRTQTFSRIDGAIEWIDGTQQAVMKFARGTAGRVDSVLDGTLGAIESGMLGTIRLVRNGAHGVAEVASDAVAGNGAEQAPAVRAA